MMQCYDRDRKKWTPKKDEVCLFVLLLMSTQETKITSEIIAEKEFLVTSTSLVIFQILIILACHGIRML